MLNYLQFTITKFNVYFFLAPLLSSLILPTFSPLIFPILLFLLCRWPDQPLPPQRKFIQNFPQTTVEGLVHVDKTTKFHFGNISWGRHILKNLERRQIVSFFFLTLQKVLQPARLRHRYCCFLESCRNQPHIWYHNSLVFSITKIGLLWNFNPIYAKL